MGDVSKLFSLDKTSRSGSHGEQNQGSTYEPSPAQAWLNKIYAGNIGSLFGLTPTASQGVVGPNSLGSLMPGGSNYDSSLWTPGASEKPFLQSIQDIASDPSSNPYIKQLTDKSSITGSMRDYYNQIVGPEIANNATVSSYGGRGSTGYNEMATRYMASVAPQMEQMYRSGLMSIPQLVQGFQAGQAGGQQAAGANRMGLMNQYMQHLDTLMKATMGIPLTNYGTNTGQTGFNQRGFGTQYGNFNDMMGTVGQANSTFSPFGANSGSPFGGQGGGMQGMGSMMGGMAAFL